MSAVAVSIFGWRVRLARMCHCLGPQVICAGCWAGCLSRWSQMEHLLLHLSLQSPMQSIRLIQGSLSLYFSSKQYGRSGRGRDRTSNFKSGPCNLPQSHETREAKDELLLLRCPGSEVLWGETPAFSFFPCCSHSSAWASKKQGQKSPRNSCHWISGSLVCTGLK